MRSTCFLVFLSEGRRGLRGATRARTASSAATGRSRLTIPFSLTLSITPLETRFAARVATTWIISACKSVSHGEDALDARAFSVSIYMREGLFVQGANARFSNVVVTIEGSTQQQPK